MSMRSINLNINDVENYLNTIFDEKIKIAHKDFDMALLKFEVELGKLFKILEKFPDDELSNRS